MDLPRSEDTLNPAAGAPSHAPPASPPLARSRFILLCLTFGINSAWTYRATKPR